MTNRDIVENVMIEISDWFVDIMEESELSEFDAFSITEDQIEDLKHRLKVVLSEEE